MQAVVVLGKHVHSFITAKVKILYTLAQCSHPSEQNQADYQSKAHASHCKTGVYNALYI